MTKMSTKMMMTMMVMTMMTLIQTVENKFKTLLMDLSHLPLQLSKLFEIDASRLSHPHCHHPHHLSFSLLGSNNIVTLPIPAILALALLVGILTSLLVPITTPITIQSSNGFMEIMV